MSIQSERKGLKNLLASTESSEQLAQKYEKTGDSVDAMLWVFRTLRQELPSDSPSLNKFVHGFHEYISNNGQIGLDACLGLTAHAGRTNPWEERHLKNRNYELAKNAVQLKTIGLTQNEIAEVLAVNCEDVIEPATIEKIIYKTKPTVPEYLNKPLSNPRLLIDFHTLLKSLNLDDVTDRARNKIEKSKVEIERMIDEMLSELD